MIYLESDFSLDFFFSFLAVSALLRRRQRARAIKNLQAFAYNVIGHRHDVGRHSVNIISISTVHTPTPRASSNCV